jgi:hypothetical protein
MMTGNGGWDGYDEGYDHAMSTDFDDGESVLSRTRLVFLADDDTMQSRGMFFQAVVFGLMCCFVCIVPLPPVILGEVCLAVNLYPLAQMGGSFSSGVAGKLEARNGQNITLCSTVVLTISCLF